MRDALGHASYEMPLLSLTHAIASANVNFRWVCCPFGLVDDIIPNLSGGHPHSAMRLRWWGVGVRRPLREATDCT